MYLRGILTLVFKIEWSRRFIDHIINLNDAVLSVMLWKERQAIKGFLRNGKDEEILVFGEGRNFKFQWRYGFNMQIIFQGVSSMNGSNMFQQQPQQPAPVQNNMALTGQGQIVSGGTVYQMVQTPQGLVAQPIQVSTAWMPTSALTQYQTCL